MNRLLPAIFGLLLTTLSSPATLAQNTPSAAVMAPVSLPTHTIRTINPTDADFADLEFLRQEIGGARVVMLGEPTHGEGNVTEAKIRLIRFLKERMGFTTVAFESGFYELDRVQQALDGGVNVAAVIVDGVYPVWSQTAEFQPLLPLLGKGQLRLAGFDSQLAGASSEQIEELEAFLKPEKGADAIAYDYLEETMSTMEEVNIFPPANSIVIFNLQLNKARKLLERIAAGPADARRRERAAFWLQNLRSIQALAHDYATNDPAVKDSAEFKAVDSNARDAQMADNLLWYLRQHPQEKVICWGALPHLANKAQALNSTEIKGFRPMGQEVKKRLGEDAVYVLGTLAGSGEYGFGHWGRHSSVPVPAAGTLEAALLAQGKEYSFLSLKHDAPGQIFTTYAFQYQPLTGPWSEVVDGFLFLKAVNPPHAAPAIAASLLAGSEVMAVAAPEPAQPIGQLNPARKPLAGKATGAFFALSGTVLDRKTGQPVPFATVAVPARSAGTITDAQGMFRLEVRRGELVQISSIGYEPATLAAPGAGGTVRLVPAAFALNDVRVSAQSQDPKRIMKKVIQATEKNYEQQDYLARVYTRRRLINFDTLRHELEYVSYVFEPAGFRKFVSFLNLGPKPVHEVLEKYVAVQSARPLGPFDLLEGGQGFLTASADPVRISPLFKAKTLSKFALQLDSVEQRNGETWYVIRFAAKRATLRSTGTYQQAGYSGKVYVREKDYAVVRYEALWQADTAGHNATAHKYYGRNNQISRLYPQVYSDSRTAHVVTYQQAANGRYHVATSVAQGLSVGRVLGKAPFYSQKYCEAYFEPLSADALANRLTKEEKPGLQNFEIWQADHTPYRPEFWQTYRRPMPAEPAPALEATK